MTSEFERCVFTNSGPPPFFFVVPFSFSLKFFDCELTMNVLTRFFVTKSRVGAHHLHSSASTLLGAKVVATRRLLPNSQARLEQQENIDLVQWQEDNTMPREQLLKDVKG